MIFEREREEKKSLSDKWWWFENVYHPIWGKVYNRFILLFIDWYVNCIRLLHTGRIKWENNGVWWAQAHMNYKFASHRLNSFTIHNRYEIEKKKQIIRFLLNDQAMEILLSVENNFLFTIY